MLTDFPSKQGPEREQLILDIIDGQPDRLTYSWHPLVITENNHTATFYVMNDALKIDGVRINLTANTEQRIADQWGCSLLTAKLSDYIWHLSEIKILPRPRPITSSTQSMIDHSKSVDAQLKTPDHFKKLISTVGKNWILSNKLFNKKDKSCNHGWHFQGNSFQGIKGNVNPSLLKDPKTNQYWKLIQCEGTAHNALHTDYSQICRLVTRECIIDGLKMDILDVFQHNELSKLANYDGILKVPRMLTVPASSTVFVF